MGFFAGVALMLINLFNDFLTSFRSAGFSYNSFINGVISLGYVDMNGPSSYIFKIFDIFSIYF